MRTVDWDPDVPAVTLVDQRLLPEEYRRLTLRTPEEVAEAIRSMAVRGAPAIGAAAAFGLALTARTSVASRIEDLWADLARTASLLRGARPTAVNLGWALDRVLRAAHKQLEDGPEALRRAVEEEALRLANEDVEINRSIGRLGAVLIQDGDTVIHHCNTGALATVDYGTALGVIRAAHELGKHVHVLVDETRPRLQGSRLTAWELQQYGIPFDIISDSAAGSFLRSGKVASVWVGADRVAANGDVANKIGTYMLALAAHDNAVPFYVAVPASSVDLSLASGDVIPIEERPEAEVLDLLAGGRPHSPQGSHARNPAFDVTPHRLVTAFITEHGALKPPFLESLQRVQGPLPPGTSRA
ncbi:MAG: S-methyl-5-thioribose-1-phosphate isomerase [Anaerolineales bacterium]